MDSKELEKIVEEAVEEAVEKATIKLKEEDEVSIIPKKSNNIKSWIAGVAVLGTFSGDSILDALNSTSDIIETIITGLKNIDVLLKELISFLNKKVF